LKDVTTANFGLLIAYVIPGFVLLSGLEPYSPTLQQWLGQSTTESTTVAGFLFVTLASIGLGLLASTLRWLVIDRIHHRRVVPPDWDFRQLPDKLPAFDRLIEDHYRYYQFHSNGLVAISIAAFLRWVHAGFSLTQLCLLVVVDGLLFAGSKDTLEKYYRRVNKIHNVRSGAASREEFANLDL